jgi:hypothetical protein
VNIQVNASFQEQEKEKTVGGLTTGNKTNTVLEASM